MEQSTTLTNSDHPHSQNSALIERHNIDKTPFWVWSDYRGNKPKYYVTMGNYKISPDLDTQEEARTWHTDNFWEALMAVMVSVIQKTEEVVKIAKEIPQG